MLKLKCALTNSLSVWKNIAFKLEAVLGKCFVFFFFAFTSRIFQNAQKLIPPALLCGSFQSEPKLVLRGCKRRKESSGGKSVERDRVMN